MTWTRSTQTGVKCDNPEHAGNPEVIVIHGVAVTALQALRAKGWHHNAKDGTHVCADCAGTRPVA